MFCVPATTMDTIIQARRALNALLLVVVVFAMM